MSTNSEKFVQLARIGSEFLALPEEAATVRAIATKASEFVPGCTAAAVTKMGRGGSRCVAASTDAVACRSEKRQSELREGPTTATLSSGQTTVVEVRQEARWPQWTELARELGLTAVITLTLSAGNEQFGVLSLYSRAAEGFSPEALSLAAAYSSYASVALFAARQASGLSNAVESRHRIGIAQGILMCRYAISKDIAFQLLRRYSNATNTKLRDVADQVYELRDLPPMRSPSNPWGPEAKLPQQRGRKCPRVAGQ
jgi:transcriptional regulator with GAF, ATPase, and Fis domain